MLRVGPASAYTYPLTLCTVAITKQQLRLTPFLLQSLRSVCIHVPFRGSLFIRGCTLLERVEA